MTSDADSPPSVLVLYDGLCGMCDQTVQWLLDKDRDRRLHFAPLDGSTAAALRARHPQIPDRCDSILVAERVGGAERVYWRSRAVMEVLRYLPRPWSWLALARWLPTFLLDLGYRLVARVRYRIFGRLDACRVPLPEERARFLP